MSQRPDDRELRVGILCNGMHFQHWQAESIRHILAVPGVKLVLIVVAGQSGEQAERPTLRTVLYRYYRKRYFRPKAMEEENLEALLGRIPAITCSVDRKGVSEYFRNADLELIRDHRPDVLLRFGFNIIRGAILNLPRYGVWSFHHGDEEQYRGGPPGFWEIMHGDRVTGAVLQRLTEKLDAGRILRKGWFPTVDHSLEETVDNVLSQSAIWPAQVCRELLMGRKDVVEGPESQTTAPICKYPGNLTFLLSRWKLWVNKLAFHKRSLQKHEEWNIGVLYQPIHELLKDRPSTNVRWLPSPAKGSFRADPFGYFENDDLNVLYEKFDQGTGLGEIARVRPKRDNLLKRSRSMLNNGRHLSYPFIVHHKDRIYVVPECHASGQVDIYSLNGPGKRLDHEQTLLKLPLLDPTLIRHDGFWWLMGTLPPHTNVGLYLYYSEDLMGPYHAHHLNPVKQDIRSSRPAGTPFMHDGQLYRPAQDSSQTYGGSVVINRVLELSPDAFKEITVKRIDPFPGSEHDQGVHTISAVGDITLVDGKRFIRTSGATKREVSRKRAKLFSK